MHSVNTPAYIIAGLIGLLVIAGIIIAIVRRRKRPPGTKPEPTVPPGSMRLREERRKS